MAKEKKRRRGGFLLLIALVLIALAILLLIGGPGLFGGEGTGIFGNGKTTETGSGDGTGTGGEVSTTTTKSGDVAPTTSETTGTTVYVAPSEISVKNDKIYYGTEEVDITALRAKLVAEYKEGTVYTVSHDDVSLLKTYDDVIAVLDDLQSTIGLQYKKVTN